MYQSRFRPARRALIFWTLFIGIGAVCGAVAMLADPTGKAMGMDATLPYFQKLPPAKSQRFAFRKPLISIPLSLPRHGPVAGPNNVQGADPS